MLTPDPKRTQAVLLERLIQAINALVLDIGTCRQCREQKAWLGVAKLAQDIWQLATPATASDFSTATQRFVVSEVRYFQTARLTPIYGAAGDILTLLIDYPNGVEWLLGVGKVTWESPHA